MNVKSAGSMPVTRKTRVTGILHEFGHNLDFRFSDNPDDDAHSKKPNHLMYAKGAGSGKIQLHINDTKAVFKFAAHMKDGSYHYGKKEAKKEAKSFMKTGYKYNAEKGKQTQFKE